MRISLLLNLMRETGLSPESLAKRMGISNMTVRRWLKRPHGEKVGEIYEKAIRDAIYQMMLDGLLTTDSRSYQYVLKTTRSLSLTAILKGLGFKNDFKKGPNFSPNRLMVGLSQIGSQARRQNEVDGNYKKIWAFSRLGRDWKDRISTLMRVVTANRVISGRDKLVAYGALFYLLCPLDLIPDNIPVFGLMDDYVVLGLASAYYLNKYKNLLG